MLECSVYCACNILVKWNVHASMCSFKQVTNAVSTTKYRLDCGCWINALMQPLFKKTKLFGIVGVEGEVCI